MCIRDRCRVYVKPYIGFANEKRAALLRFPPLLGNTTFVKRLLYNPRFLFDQGHGVKYVFYFVALVYLTVLKNSSVQIFPTENNRRTKRSIKYTK